MNGSTVEGNSLATTVSAPNSQATLLSSTDAMASSLFRILYRARSRSQRKRVYAWILVFSVVLFLFLYSQQFPLLTYQQSLVDNVETRELKMDNIKVARLGPEMKLMNANDNDEGVKKKRINEYGEEEEDESRADLLPDLAPSIIHFIWCGRRQYEFRHYLSIKRADFVIKPDKIFFHYEELPIMDPEKYYTWFSQTLTDNAHIVLKRLNMTKCPESGPEKYMLVLNLLESFGGIYIPQDAILVDFPIHLRAAQFVSGVVAKTLSDYLDGIIVAKKNGFISPSSQTGLSVVLASGRSAAQGTIEPCGSIEHFNTEEKGDCICVKVTREIFPANIWDSRSNFAQLSRVAGYGMNEVRPKFTKQSTIPRIAHYICWDCELKFSTYVSVLSALNIAGLAKVYMHGVKQPTGLWWRKLQETQRVIHVYREYPEHSRATMTQELAQGMMRVNILLKYGGVYCDSKVIWTNLIPEDHFGYDAVASPDWHQYGAWPDSISHSTIMAKKNSEYLLKLRNFHSQKHKQRFWFVDGYLAYKILEENPDVLFLDRHFQVKCQNQNCHPTWHPGYKASVNENPPGPKFNWQNDTLSVYWDVFPELELETVKYTSGAVVEAARRALHRSGVSIQDLTNR